MFDLQGVQLMYTKIENYEFCVISLINQVFNDNNSLKKFHRIRTQYFYAVYMKCRKTKK